MRHRGPIRSSFPTNLTATVRSKILVPVKTAYVSSSLCSLKSLWKSSSYAVSFPSSHLRNTIQATLTAGSNHALAKLVLNAAAMQRLP